MLPTPGPNPVVFPPSQPEAFQKSQAKMADEDVATRAPESDAQEGQTTSGIPGDSKPAQGAASMGEVTKYNDIDVYVSKPKDYPHQSGKLLLLLTGGTGVHSTNNQLQAD
ncbi:hypothetical protein LTR53_018494, partial [Teratosphaeriaceae sp. CCFEE 6253]